MSFQMMQVSILSRLLSFIGHMDQQIESIAFRIAMDDGYELLFVNRQHRMHGFAKSVQKTAAFLAIDRGSYPWFGGKIVGSHG
ncbi:MAG: hypothetical protein M3O35_19410 [Acidobacteriota bacterium]|nr:hypothetical protein [Acidobacteriota bacterium]